MSKIVPLKYILENDREAINIVSESLKTRGYSFIRLDENIIKRIDLCIEIMEGFFNQDANSKKNFTKDVIFGYFGVSHKESFRILTGNRIYEQKYPENFAEIKNLVKHLDQIMYTMVLLLAPNLFPNILIEAEKLDIPLMKKQNTWAMFDVAKYHNDGKRSGPNCDPHADPGLLSFSVRSTQPGLQLKNEKGEWISPPNDNSIAILWAGLASAKINSKIKPGYHRVNSATTIGVPRLSMWHEVCLASQEHKELLDKKIPEKMEKSTGIPMTKSIRPTMIEKADPIKFESKTGIPMTKSIGPIMSTNPIAKSAEYHTKKDYKYRTTPNPSNLNSSPMFTSYHPKNSTY